MFVCINPDCKDKSFTSHGTMTTLMGWFPRYDEYGRPLNADPNTSTTEYTCGCGRKYVKVEKGWSTKFYDSNGQIIEDQDNTPDYIK